MEKSKRILIIESSPTDMLAKMSLALSKRGYKTVLLTLTGDIDTPLLKEAYSKRISLNFKFFKIGLKTILPIFAYSLKKILLLFSSFMRLRKINPYITIVRTTPNWLYFLVKKSYNKSPVIYFPYDIRSFCYSNVEEAISSGAPKFELNAEKWAFENADGIIHKGSEDELELLNKQILGDIKIKSPVIHFLPYCSEDLIAPLNRKKLSKEDKQIHIVHPGSISMDSRWISPLYKIASQGIHIHLYIKTANLPLDIYKKMGALLKNKFIHIHQPLDQKSLIREISKYDYGIWYGSDNVYKENITLATGNKISTYLEAGLPFFYLKNYIYLDKLMKDYKISICLDSYKDLKPRLKRLDYWAFVERIEKARHQFTMEKNIPRLEKFFEEVRRFKLNNSN